MLALNDWVLDIDVKGYFDSIYWGLLLKAVRLIRMPMGATRHRRRPKAPCGWRMVGVVGRQELLRVGLSALRWRICFWIRLRHVDDRTFPAIPFERYADDCICHCRSEEEARALWEALEVRFAACGLVLHPQKTKLVSGKRDDRRGGFPFSRLIFWA